MWAYGFRNPFGLALARDELFTVENGRDIDRFLRIRPGEDHYWDGTDASIAPGADAVLHEGPSPVQMTFVAGSSEWVEDAFVFAVFNDVPSGPMMIEYDYEQMRPEGPPRHLLQYLGDGARPVVAVDAGPEAIYTAPGFPDESGETPVLRLAYDPEDAHGTVIGAGMRAYDPALAVLEAHSCLSCLARDGVGGGIAPRSTAWG